jgi:hypothetical protein
VREKKEREREREKERKKERQRERKTERVSLGEFKIQARLYFIMGLRIFIEFIKILFAVHLKHSCLWPSADVRHMSNDLVHAKL